jgi:hypothetical protein
MHIAQQHESIESLERLGLDAPALKGALIQFEELRAMHIADRDRSARPTMAAGHVESPGLATTEARC